MQVKPLTSTLRAIAEPGKILLLSPQGYPFNQKMARELAHHQAITLVCGRYEGIDARLEELFPITPVSIGDAVLNGGETAALAVIEAVARLLPGFMGKEESGDEESFSQHCLEYPHYSRPEIFEDKTVPQELLSGNHAGIAQWRRKMALHQTWKFRQDLLNETHLSRDDAEVLKTFPRTRLGRNLSFCLVHHPVQIDGKKSGISSLTNLDIHDIARISASYGLGPMYVVTPLLDQQTLLRALLNHWTHGAATASHPDRAKALACVRSVTSIEDAIDYVASEKGVRPTVIASSASWTSKRHGNFALNACEVRTLLDSGPVLLCLGTAQGLAKDAVAMCDATLRPLRFLDYNHFSVRSAAAIYADRILGDFK